VALGVQYLYVDVRAPEDIEISFEPRARGVLTQSLR
jgi:hypothetical protein